MGTMTSIYPGTYNTQQARNIGTGQMRTPTRAEFEVPVIGGLSSYTGLSIPALVAIGALAFFLIERYDD